MNDRAWRSEFDAALAGNPPDEVRIEEIADGVRYILPDRVLGGGHVFGAAVIVAGVVVLLGGVWWSLTVLFNSMPPWPDVLISLIGPVAIMLIGAVLWISGQFIAAGRTVLEFRGGQPASLHRIERAGVLRWRSRARLARLRRLRVAVGLTEDETIDEAITSGLTMPLASLLAEYESGETTRLLIAYPPQWIEEVAYDLAGRLSAHPARQQSDPIEVLTAGAADETDPEAQQRAAPGTNVGWSQPPESTIEISRTRDGITIVIPPRSMWRDRKGVSAHSALSGMLAAITASAVGFVNSPWYVSTGIAAFWGIGSLFVLAAVAVGRRSALIDIIEDRESKSLLLTQKSYFKIIQRGWSREELRAIECSPSGMEVNDKPVMELRITPASGGTVSYFTGRDEDELQWLAHTLRQALEVSEDTDLA